MFEQLTVCELKQGTKIYHRFLVRNVSFWINKILEQNHSIEDRTNIVRNYLSLPWITFFILIVLGVLESIFYQAVHQNVYLENALLIFTCLMIITMIAYLILGGKERHWRATSWMRLQSQCSSKTDLDTPKWTELQLLPVFPGRSLPLSTPFVFIWTLYNSPKDSKSCLN